MCRDGHTKDIFQNEWNALWTIMSFRKVNEWWTNELETDCLCFILVRPWKRDNNIFCIIFLQTFPVLIQPGPVLPNFFFGRTILLNKQFSKRTNLPNRHLVKNWTKLKKNNRYLGKQTNLNVTERLKTEQI